MFVFSLGIIHVCCVRRITTVPLISCRTQKHDCSNHSSGYVGSISPPTGESRANVECNDGVEIDFLRLLRTSVLP